MKKFLFITMLCSSFAFATNPKNLDTKKIIALNSTLEKNGVKKVDHACIYLFRATYSLCMGLGFSYENSMSAANAAFDACLNVFYPQSSSSEVPTETPTAGDSFGG